MLMHATKAYYFKIFMLQRIYTHFTKHYKMYNILCKWTHINGEKKHPITLKR